METIKKLEEKQREELEEFTKACPHTDILIEDETIGFRCRTITIRCKRCRLNLLGYIIDNSLSYLSYVRDCVNGYPKKEIKDE